MGSDEPVIPNKIECSDDERQELARLITAHTAQYNSIQQALKEATLNRREHVAKRAAMERQQLLGTPDGALRRRQIINDADAINTSIGVTESLRRTRQMMSEVRYSCDKIQ